MALTEYELVLIGNGEIVLQRAGSNEPLVTINFSSPVMDYLGNKHVDVAKAMIDAGIKAAVDLNESSNVSKPLTLIPNSIVSISFRDLFEEYRLLNLQS